MDVEAGVAAEVAHRLGLRETLRLGAPHAPYSSWGSEARGLALGLARDLRRGAVAADAIPSVPNAGRTLTLLHTWGFISGYAAPLQRGLQQAAETWLARNNCPRLPVLDSNLLVAALYEDAAGVVTADPDEAVRSADAGVRTVLLDHRHGAHVLSRQRLKVVPSWAAAATEILAWPEVRAGWDERSAS